MAFELKPGKSLRKDIRRIVRKQIDRACELLAGGLQLSTDEAVHETRIAFKKIRAVLRLIRAGIGEKTYHKRNTQFRDAGRPLTDIRDAKILVDVFSSLLEHYHDQIANQSFAEIRDLLRENMDAVRQRILGQQEVFADIAKTVCPARRTVKRWTDVRDQWSSIGPGVSRTYRRARVAYRRATVAARTLRLHEWRKQTKYLRYQLDILRPIWPERVDELISKAHRMGELLGDDHDLAVLRQMLSDEPDKFDGAVGIAELIALIDCRRTELQQQAASVAEKFFVERPDDFARRLKGYWTSWRDQQKRDESATPHRIST